MSLLYKIQSIGSFSSSTVQLAFIPTMDMKSVEDLLFFSRFAATNSVASVRHTASERETPPATSVVCMDPL